MLANDTDRQVHNWAAVSCHWHTATWCNAMLATGRPTSVTPMIWWWHYQHGHCGIISHSFPLCVCLCLTVCLSVCVCVSVCLRAILVLIVTLFVCLLLSLSKSHIDVRLFCSQLVLLPAYCCSLPVSVSVYLPLSASVCVWVFKQLVATSTVRLDLTTVDCKSSQPPQCRVDMILTAVIGLESDDDGG